jgi:hypothetical protein
MRRIRASEYAARALLRIARHVAAVCVRTRWQRWNCTQPLVVLAFRYLGCIDIVVVGRAGGGYRDRLRYTKTRANFDSFISTRASAACSIRSPSRR